MKQRCLLLVSLLSCLGSPGLLLAAEPELVLDLPNVQWLHQPTSPPQLQKEGLPLVTEEEFAGQLLRMIDTADFETAITQLRERDAALLELLEAGDPQSLILTRAVPGGFMPVTRPNQISATLLYLIGHVYLAREEFVPAETAFKRALGPVPDYIRVHESLGLLYLRTERYDLALGHLSHAASLGLNTANLYGALGYLNQQVGSYWGAISAYEKALMLDYTNPAWQQGLLYAFSETRQHESALSLVDQMLQTTPDDAALWLFRSNFALMAEDRATALASLETAIRLGNDAAANLQVAATLHLLQGSTSRAITLIQDGMAQGIDYPFIDQSLQWLVRAEQWDALDELLPLALARQDELSSQQRSSLLTRQASLDLHNDAQTRAITALQEALELDPANAEALLALAGIYRENRNFNQAELLYQRATAFDVYRENAQIALAQIAIDQSNYPRALQVLNDVLRRNPARSDLRRNIESLENLVLLQTDN